MEVSIDEIKKMAEELADKEERKAFILLPNIDGFQVFEVSEEIAKSIIYIQSLRIQRIEDILTAWEQYKKANWFESNSIDVEKKLMHDFSASYGR